MYHFYFNLPKNDKNNGTVFLPMKSSMNVPVIISCYGWNKIHWPKRVDEGLHDKAVNKNNMGYITMELAGESDDTDSRTFERWKNNLKDMVAWVKAKNFTNTEKIGLFAFGTPALAALCVADEVNDVAFAIVTLCDETDNEKINNEKINNEKINNEKTNQNTINIDNPNELTETVNNGSTEKIEELMSKTKIPLLILQGTTDKITFQTKKPENHKITKTNNKETKSTHIIFHDADIYLYNIVDQTTDEIIKWLKEIGI